MVQRGREIKKEKCEKMIEKEERVQPKNEYQLSSRTSHLNVNISCWCFSWFLFRSFSLSLFPYSEKVKTEKRGWRWKRERRERHFLYLNLLRSSLFLFHLQMSSPIAFLLSLSLSLLATSITRCIWRWLVYKREERGGWIRNDERERERMGKGEVGKKEVWREGRDEFMCCSLSTTFLKEEKEWKWSFVVEARREKRRGN